MREADVVAAVHQYVGGQGFDLLPEFPLLGRVADLFGVRGQRCSIAIECKERDWRRGVNQARRYLAAVDEVYLAVPGRVVTEELTQTALKVGIGVLGVGVDNVVSVVVVADSRGMLLPSLQARAVMQFNQRRGLDG
jgi:hypothetical protein